MSFSFKHVLLCVAAMCCALSPKAVLPEGNIDRTMVMLSEDMKVLQQNITTDLQRFDDKLKEFRQEMHVLNDNCDEAGLVLYTQDERYLYGALQATQNMRNVIDRIQKLKKDLARLDDAISTVSLRYDKLSDFLEKLKSRNLTADGREALMASQTMTDSLNRCLSRSINELKADSIAYHNLLAKTDSLGKYNDKVLQQLHSRIFTTGNETLPYIFSHFSNCWNDFKHDLAWRFFTGQSDSDAWKSAEDRMFDLCRTNRTSCLPLTSMHLSRFAR